MPVINRQNRREFASMIEDVLHANGVENTRAAVRELFMGGLDFAREDASVPLDHPHLPAAATVIARRDGIYVAVVLLPERGYIRLDALRKAVDQLENRLAGEVIVVAANADRMEWQIVTQKETANRPVLRRMVIRREGYRTVIEQLDELATAIDGGADLRNALDTAYNVEPVRARFFKRYAAVFGATTDALAPAMPDAELRKLFCQRLFNRLLFVRFLEKRGWLRLRPGDERTDYLRALWRAYNAERHESENFYRDRLCPLFFDGLNTDHPSNYVHPQVGIVPYLNGGLFDPEKDDRNTNVVIPDGVFTAICGDGGATEGLLYQFNFTVTEATPLDVEVAVDPEMLGKVFEELVTGRHESGSYYTPKPIVSFMGREALKGYLRARLPHESPQAIARFVDEHKPEDLAHGEAVLDALKRVRICDPACGSGAYLLGMLHELLDLRQCLFNTRGLDPLADYDRKLAIIQQNLYGVDIDPFATGVARLRLWLSLIVDFMGNELPTLPNLDYKIGTGDSLTTPAPSTLGQGSLGGDQIAELDAMMADFLKAHSDHKIQLRAAIDSLRLVLRNILGNVDGFDWRVEFAGVFLAGGFDVVLANPPYVRADAQFTHLSNEAERQKAIGQWKKYRQALKNGKIYVTIHEKWDLFIPFLERAYQLARANGQVIYIIPDSYNANKYTESSHQFFLANTRVQRIDFCSDIPLFGANVRNTIVHFIKDAATATHLPTRVRRYGVDASDFDKNAEVLPTELQQEYGDDLFKPNSRPDVSRNLLALC